MTIRSHPWLKLLVAIVAAIAVRIMSDSGGWSIATFFILMFIFIWVAEWIFGGPIKGKVEVTDELEELLYKLDKVGRIKDTLPLSLRGWCNVLGLYVQLKATGSMGRLEAGDKLRTQIDAWWELTDFPPWKIMKYNPGEWEKLVEPTLAIAEWLDTHGGLREEHRDSLTKAVETFKKEGHLELPDVKKAGEEPLKPHWAGEQSRESGKSKTPPNIANRIKEYDRELIEDIERLKKLISEDEEMAKDFMRSCGASARTAEEVARKARTEGKPIGTLGFNRDMLRIQAFLTEMVTVYKEFPFRVWTQRREDLHRARTNITTEDNWFIFDTRPLDNEERREYAKQLEATRVLNYTFRRVPGYKSYPNTQLMRFVAKMLAKYGGSVLTKDQYQDANMEDAWEEIYRSCQPSSDAGRA